MRKIAYSLIAILAALTFAGCSDHFTPASESDGHGLTFSITVPAASAITTRSFSAEAITSLHVLVFDENGYFVECQKAQPTVPVSFGTDMNTEYKFSVNLQASPNKRILHFVANYDFESNPVEYGTEYSVISHLTVGDRQEAYWQRVVLEEGIYEKFDDMPEKGKLVKIPLVRNFAKVVVESKIDNFEVIGYALWNVPDKGSVAPCVLASQAFATYAKREGDPVDGFDNNPWVCRAYDELSAHYADDSKSSGYKGYLPENATIVSTDASSLTFDNNAKHMYERPFSDDETNTAIIVKGKYNGNISFYKIDLVMPPEQGVSEHYNILRNYTFKAKVVGCSADGYQNAQEAAMNPASNNFMASVVTQDVINISDGTARLFVTYTDTTIVSSDPFVFRYKYYPDFKSNPNDVENKALSFYDLTRREALTRDDYNKEYVELGSPYFVMAKYNVIEEVTTGPWAGWHQTTITPDTPTDEERSESVIIYQMTKDNNQVKIARTVTFRLRKPFTMIPECEPAKVSAGVGRKVKVNIKIPSGLRESLFPLEFKIEAVNNSLSPDNSLTADQYRSGYMSTWYGKSIIPNNGKQSYGFTKTLSYNEYLSMDLTDDNSYRIVPCAFVTTKSNSATEIWIQNKYFYFGDGQSTAQFNN
ncbi:MAG TPA: hypothetical protein DD383_04845 [Rikenellaceae bacterium]|nr:hypothetical protein [Rikenellaceae bacterium]